MGSNGIRLLVAFSHAQRPAELDLEHTGPCRFQHNVHSVNEDLVPDLDKVSVWQIHLFQQVLVSAVVLENYSQINLM